MEAAAFGSCDSSRVEQAEHSSLSHPRQRVPHVSIGALATQCKIRKILQSYFIGSRKSKGIAVREI